MFVNSAPKDNLSVKFQVKITINRIYRKAIHSLDTNADEQALTNCTEEFDILHIATINRNNDERDEVYASIELLITYSKTICM